MKMSMLVTKAAFVLLALALQATSTQAAPMGFATEVSADGPIGYWRLGEGAVSASAADSSGRGNNGTYSGSGITLGQPGIQGGDTAALFDGVRGRIVVLNSNSLNPSNITMEAKIRWDGRNGFQQRILEKSSFAELAQYGLSILDDGHVQVEIRTTASGTTSVNFMSSAVVALGVETHVVATYDGRVIRIYLNGILDSQTDVGVNAGDISPKPPTPANLKESGVGIGNQVQRDRPFKGLIDEVALYGTALSPERIRAHYQSQFAEPGMFQYAVKFVCGISDGRVVAPGAYFTAINVHNPNERGIGFRKKFAIALPGERPGPVSKFFDAKLGPDEAFEIDCPDILRRTDTRERFLKGFAVIESALELDVVAVYTAAGATRQVETMEIERVKPRGQGVQGKPDLIPVPDPRLGFCRRQNMKLTVTVKNQGSTDAGPSVTRVDFGNFGIASQPTPALAAGASIDLLFDIPPGCFNPDCEFRITVDSNNQVNESNEGNNTGSGSCLG